MNFKSLASLLSICVYTGFLSSNIHAATIIDENFGLSSPDKIVIDFGETSLFAAGTVIDNQFSGSGVTFGTTYAYNYEARTFPARSRGFLENKDNSSQPGSIFSSSDVRAADFSWRTNNGTTAFSAYNNDILVEAFTEPTNTALNSGRYFGFQDIIFDEIRFLIDPVNISKDNYFSLDNLEFVSANPVPAAGWLFGSGLIGLIGIARYKR